MRHFPRAFISALAAFAVAGSAAAFSLPNLLHPATGQTRATAPPAAPLKPGVWPQAHSDLKADPNIRFGALPNGMRYAIMRNATPPGQASLRLVFSAGSLMETDDQQGLAHFLEHMAFNGSKAVPRGEMVKILQRHGLAFGADTNASTGFDATDYKLDLPANDADTIDSSLMLLRELAGELTLDQDAIDHERGVILSEERLRDTPPYRIYKSRLAFLMQGQRPPQRLPIGLVPVVQGARRAQIADFYGKYYRPDRATLIAVGDFDPDAMEARIKAKFGGWTNAAAPGADPDLGKVAARGLETRIAVEDGAPTSIQFAWVSAPDLSPDSQAKQRRLMIQRLGLAVLNRRLATIARQDDPPFVAAGAFAGNQVRAEHVTSLVVNALPGHWQDAMTAAEAEQRRIAQFGVRPDELAREIAEQDALLKLAASQAATRRTPDLANEIESTLEENEVETSPADDLALFEAVTRDLKPEEVSAALKELFAGSGPLIFLSSPTPIDGGEAAVKSAYEAARKTPVTAPAAPHDAVWPYTDFGNPGKVADRQEVTDLDTVFVRFDNGVRLTIKPTKFRDDQVLVKVRIGDGLRGLAPDRQNMGWAGSSFVEGGLKQISADDTDRALASSVYAAQFGLEDDAFVLSGATKGADLDTQLQVLAAYATEPGWRPEAFQRMKTYGETLENQYEATDGGVLGRDLSGLLHGGDRRWTFPTRAEIAGESQDDLRSQVAPALANGPIEVVIVGDITVDKAIDAVAATFGALPKRPDPAPPSPPAHDPAFPAAVAQPVVLTHKGRADQAIGYVAWPTDDFFANPQQARIDGILGEVMQLRLLDMLRMDQGVTYSPVTGHSASLVWPRWGYVSAEVEVPPAKLDLFFADVAKIAAGLRDGEVSADELQRAKAPRIDALEKAMASNEYWLSGLSGAQSDPRRLDALRSAQAGLERISAADVRRAAQTYLHDDKAWKLVVKPAGS